MLGSATVDEGVPVITTVVPAVPELVILRSRLTDSFVEGASFGIQLTRIFLHAHAGG